MIKIVKYFTRFRKGKDELDINGIAIDPLAVNQTKREKKKAGKSVKI